MDVREKLVELVRNAFAAYGDGITGCAREEFFADFIAADVVPKVELEAMRTAANSLKMHYEEAVADIKTLIAEMDFLVEKIYRVFGAEVQIYGKCAEIKKKYMEEE